MFIEINKYVHKYIIIFKSKIQEWRVLLKKIVKAEAEVILHQGGTRDYLGIQKDGRIKNIATAYNSFDFWLRQQLK